MLIIKIRTINKIDSNSKSPKNTGKQRVEGQIVQNGRYNMVRLIMHGCNGHMGQVISNLVKNDPDAEIVAGVDVVSIESALNTYPVFVGIGSVPILLFDH